MATSTWPQALPAGLEDLQTGGGAGSRWVCSLKGQSEATSTNLQSSVIMVYKATSPLET